jgi:hypothetical protein
MTDTSILKLMLGEGRLASHLRPAAHELRQLSCGHRRYRGVELDTGMPLGGGRK